MPSGCRSRSNWPLTGRTAARSPSGQAVHRARPAPGGDDDLGGSRSGRLPPARHRAPGRPRCRAVCAVRAVAAASAGRGQHRGHPVPHGPHPGGGRRLAQRGGVPAVVDRPVAGEQHPAVHVRGEEGLQLAAGPAVEFLRVQPGGAAERRQPHQRGVVARVVGDGQRALSAQAHPVTGHLLELGRERREPGQGEQVDAEQRALAEQGLRDRGEHPCRHLRRGVVLGGIGQDDIEPGGGGPPGDRGPDDTAARDDDICGDGHEILPSPALPGSGTTVGGARPPSQPLGAPVFGNCFRQFTLYQPDAGPGPVTLPGRSGPVIGWAGDWMGR